MFNIDFHVGLNVISVKVGAMGKETVTYNDKEVSVIKNKWSEAFKSDHTHAFEEFEEGKLARYVLNVKGNLNSVHVTLMRDGQPMGSLESTATELMRRKTIAVYPEDGVAAEAQTTEAHAEPVAGDSDPFSAMAQAAESRKKRPAAAQTAAAEPDGKWWQTALWGLFLVGIAVALYFYFVDFESSNDASRRMNAIVALLYNIGGKWLACGVIGGMGVLLIFFSANEYKNQKQ